MTVEPFTVKPLRSCSAGGPAATEGRTVTAEKFTALAQSVYGQFGWKTAIAKVNQCHVSTVLRWSRGEIPVPDAARDALIKAAMRKIVAVLNLVLGA